MKQPAWLLAYETTDISDEIADVTKRIRYTDYLKDKSDEIEVVLEDAAGLWRGPWYPSKGDRVDLKIGYVGEPLLPCGRFEIDTVELSGSRGAGDVVTVRGLAAGMSSPLRTVRTRGFEDVGLDAIVAQIAGEHGFEILGDVPQEVMRRVSQSNETDLAFLKRMAEAKGYAFSVRGDKLTFYRIAELEALPPVMTLGVDTVSSYRFTNSSQKTYRACIVEWYDSETGETITGRADAEGVRLRGSDANATSAEDAVAPSSMIREGSRGDQVREWQTWLASRGLYDAAIDGIFGPITDRGTRSFQREQEIQVDGIVGPITYGAAIELGFVPGGSADPETTSTGDVLVKRERVESVADAEVRAANYLRAANRLQVTGEMTVPGDPRLVAGAKVELVGRGRLDGYFEIGRSVHTIAKASGYTTRLEELTRV